MDDKRRRIRQLPIARLILLMLLSTTSQAIALAASTTFYPGVVYHSMAGGGIITFAAIFTSTHMSYIGNYIVFNDFTWAGVNFGTLGFMCPAGASYVVTLVTASEVDIMTTVTVPATVLGIYAPGNINPSAAIGTMSFSWAADKTSLVCVVGVIPIFIQWLGGGGGGGGGGGITPPKVEPPLPDFGGLQNAGAIFIVAVILVAIVGGEYGEKKKTNRDRFRKKGSASGKWKTGDRYK